jgi:phage N-6-adenine-methyltransferase
MGRRTGFLHLKNEILSIMEYKDNTDDTCSSSRKVSQQQPKTSDKKSDNWYTPPHIISLVVIVLGEIDLDPCAENGKKIPARSHYTINEDGLSKQWHGRVFLNPPYSCPGKWIAKLIEEITTGRVTEAIALVPGATDTNWLSPVLKTQPVCFWKGRIKFLDTNYEPKLPARQSHVLIYWGRSSARFQEVFEEYGVFKPSTYSSTHNRDANQVLGENISHSIPRSTQVEHDTQTDESSLLLSISDDHQLSNADQVLGENISHSISPSTRIEHDAQSKEDSLSLDTELSNADQVLGENISHSISPSTRIEHDAQIEENSLSLSIPSDTQLSNNLEVLGENILPTIPRSTHRKHGEGSGNLSWGYANANSKKKKPIKQLYFEWEYGGMRGKTYVRTHLKEEVIALNEAKAPVFEILELLTYNLHVARSLGIV